MADEPDTAGFRAGDPDAVRAVYRSYGGLVFTVAYRVLGDRALAEDATQQAFLQAWRAAPSFDGSRDFGPWLATIARRAAIDIQRRESRRSHASLDDVPAAHPAITALPPSAESASDALEVRRALSALPPDEREVVRLHHLEGLAQSEIAERLAVPLGTVKSRSARAYRRLASTLGHLREGTA
jgi:RNA polymerase sigma-70 factor (ECF subfamily)